MTLTSKPLALIVLIVILGGIAVSSGMGWWTTESTKQPVTFTEGEFAGEANPADIRGSYTFGDISRSFDITPEVLDKAFGVDAADPSTFAVKDLEALYLDSGYEIGTASIRLFVAYYTGLPFDTTGQVIQLPQSAADILVAKGGLTADQLAYVGQNTVQVGEATPAPEPALEASPTPSADTTIKGKTTFGELLAWGVPRSVIEGLIGAALPDPAMTLKDYASANGLDFETLKPALQTEVDKVQP